MKTGRAKPEKRSIQNIRFESIASVAIPAVAGGDFTAVYAEEIAKELRINPLQLRSDMNSASTTSAIERTSALASALGFIGTPVLVVGHTMVQGNIKKDQLQRLIEIERKLKIGEGCQ